MKVRKAIITAAGWGTRFLPATKAQPKEMLPLVDKPMIQYVVEEAVASGMEQIIIVTSLGKHAIEDHFDRSFELEYALERKGEVGLLREIRRISELANICYIRQREQLGLGHAVLTAEELIGDEPFALLLPDEIIEAEVPAIKQLLVVYDRYPGNIVAVGRIARGATRRYGIINPCKLEERLYRVLSLVEKPEPAEAPSDLAMVGRYILMPEIFQMLRLIRPGKGGEIQLTDALGLLLGQQPIYGYELGGTRYDAGTPLEFVKTLLGLALHRPDIGPELKEYLRGLKL